MPTAAALRFIDDVVLEAARKAGEKGSARKHRKQRRAMRGDESREKIEVGHGRWHGCSNTFSLSRLQAHVAKISVHGCTTPLRVDAVGES